MLVASCCGGNSCLSAELQAGVAPGRCAAGIARSTGIAVAWSPPPPSRRRWPKKVPGGAGARHPTSQACAVVALALGQAAGQAAARSSRVACSARAARSSHVKVAGGGCAGTGTVVLQVPEKHLALLPKDIRSDAEAEQRYLLTALKIGLKALTQAEMSLDVDFVEKAFREFRDEVREYLYETNRSLKDHLAGDDSRLARMLLAEFGEHGRLATQLESAHRRLADPEMKNSIPNVAAELMRTTLNEQQDCMRDALSTTDPHSPLGIFLSQQQQVIRSLQDDYDRKLGNLSEQVGSIKATLGDETLEGRVEVLYDKSTAKGVDFEDDGHEALAKLAAVFGDEVESCGTSAVDKTARKIGDQIIRINQPGAPGLCIVVEQKSGKVSKKVLLKQMRDAMELRGAQAAIGLVRRSNLPKNLAAYQQHGPHQVIVGVDWSDDTDWFALEVAYRALRTSLISSVFQVSASVNADSIKRGISQIESALSEAQRIKVNLTAARSNLDVVAQSVSGIEERVRGELASMERALSSHG